MKKSNNPPTDDDFMDLNTEIEHLVNEEERIRKLRQEKQVLMRRKLYEKIVKPQIPESSTQMTVGEATGE